MSLLGVQYEPVSLDVSNIVLKKKRISLLLVKNQGKFKALLNGVD